MAAQLDSEAQDSFNQWCLMNSDKMDLFHGWDEVKSYVYRHLKKLHKRPPTPKSIEHFMELMENSDHRWNYFKFCVLKNLNKDKNKNTLFQIISCTKTEYEENANTNSSVLPVLNGLPTKKRRILSQCSNTELQINIIQNNQRMQTIKHDNEEMKQELMTRTINPSEYDMLFYQGGTELFTVFFTKRLMTLLSICPVLFYIHIQ